MSGGECFGHSVACGGGELRVGGCGIVACCVAEYPDLFGKGAAGFAADEVRADRYALCERELPVEGFGHQPGRLVAGQRQDSLDSTYD